VRVTIRPNNGITWDTRSGAGGTCLTPDGVLSNNTWHHLAITRSGLSNLDAIYIDGIDKATDKTCDAMISSNYPTIRIGNVNTATRLFNGTIDEFSVWNRSLSISEVNQLYKRGVLRLNLSARSCDDAVCAGEEFANANLTNSTGASISNLTNNRFFQYKSFFETDNLSFSPELYNVTVHYSFVPTVGGDTCTCPSSDDWNMNAADNCKLTSNCNLQDNNFNCYGSGTFTMYATISNYNIRTIHAPCQWICHSTECWRRE